MTDAPEENVGGCFFIAQEICKEFNLEKCKMNVDCLGKILYTTLSENNNVILRK